MQLTPEQDRIVSSRAGRLAVQARAGSGKTSTVRAYAAARPRSRVLYVAFNKAIQLEAASKMPANVTCRTTHSVAYRVATQLFGADVQAKVGNTYPSTVAKALGCSPLAATGAQQAVQRWCGSLDEEIGALHIPPDIAKRAGGADGLVPLARALWGRMMDPRHRDVRMPHDGYLKLFQLDRPILRGYDTIAVDEAQDLNPCTLDIVRHQRCAQILVGDSAQAIYQFRGAVNALALFDAQERLQLTKSFRFGQGIAALANALLGHFKDDFTSPIVGAGQPQRTAMSVDSRRSFAVIARTNAVIFEEAVRLLSEHRSYTSSAEPRGTSWRRCSTRTTCLWASAHWCAIRTSGASSRSMRSRPWRMRRKSPSSSNS